MTGANQEVHIDIDSIPQYVRPFLLAPIVDAVTEYMKQPGVAEKYEAWLAEKKAAEAAKQKE
jgi:hypothetical protein